MEPEPYRPRQVRDLDRMRPAVGGPNRAEGLPAAATRLGEGTRLSFSSSAYFGLVLLRVLRAAYELSEEKPPLDAHDFGPAHYPSLAAVARVPPRTGVW